jgi:hypothetical protein
VGQGWDSGLAGLGTAYGVSIDDERLEVLLAGAELVGR